MKKAYFIPALLALLPAAWAADPVSIEEFKRIKDYCAREEVIKQAPPEQREEFEKIHLHLRLLAKYKTEDNIRLQKEQGVIKLRGLDSIEYAFSIQINAWYVFYAGECIRISEKPGATNAEKLAAEVALQKEHEDLDQRWKAIRILMVRLAPTPEATKLNERCKDVVAILNARYDFNTEYSMELKSNALLMKSEKELRELLEEVKRLPALSAEEAEQECEAYPESKIHLSL